MARGGGESASDGAASAPAPRFLSLGTAPQGDVMRLEFIDDTDSEIYGARLWLIPNKHGLMYLLRQKRDD